MNKLLVQPLTHASLILLFALSYQVISLWRFHWLVYLWVLPVLLLCTVRYVRLHADLFLLRVHGLCLLCFLPYAWSCWLSCFFVLCTPHISLHKVRVKIRLSVFSSSLNSMFPCVVKSFPRLTCLQSLTLLFVCTVTVPYD